MLPPCVPDATWRSSGLSATVQHSTGPASILFNKVPWMLQILMWLSSPLEATTAGTPWCREFGQESISSSLSDFTAASRVGDNRHHSQLMTSQILFRADFTAHTVRGDLAATRKGRVNKATVTTRSKADTYREREGSRGRVSTLRHVRQRRGSP